MKKEEVQSLFAMAKIEVLGMWELMNPVLPRERVYFEILMIDAWWLVKTKKGMITIGYRRRDINLDWRAVIHIDWSDIQEIRKEITSDNGIKGLTFVHAQNETKTLEYLTALGKEIDQLSGL